MRLKKFEALKCQMLMIRLDSLNVKMLVGYLNGKPENAFPNNPQ